MRDLTRIDRVLAKVRVLWEANPDWRLGQLLVNASEPHPPMPEVYYLEDEVFEERIDALLEDREGAAAAVEAQRFARIGEGLAERGFGSGGADEAVDLAMEAHRRVSEGDGGPAGEP